MPNHSKKFNHLTWFIETFEAFLKSAPTFVLDVSRLGWFQDFFPIFQFLSFSLYHQFYSGVFVCLFPVSIQLHFHVALHFMFSPSFYYIPLNLL